MGADRRHFKIEGNALMEQSVKGVGNNGCFGKMIQNPGKYSDVRLVDDDIRFLSCDIVNPNLAIVQLQQDTVEANDTPHVGLAILNLAKTKMIDDIYTMQDLMPHEFKLYYTDTDSIYCKVPDNFLDIMIKSGAYKQCLDLASS